MKMKHEPVRSEVGRAMAEKIGAVGYLECSARTKEGQINSFLFFLNILLLFSGVREVFEFAARSAMMRKRKGKGGCSLF